MAAGETDRTAGALLGLAVGDALGAGYEFEPPPPAAGDWNDDFSGWLAGLEGRRSSC